MVFNFLKNMFVSNAEVSTGQTMQYNIQEIEDELKRDFIENSKVYFVSWRDQVHLIKYIQDVLESVDVSVTETDIYNTFLELYRLSMEVEGITQFNEILSKERVRVVKEKLRFVPRRPKDCRLSADEYLEFNCNSQYIITRLVPLSTVVGLDFEKERISDIKNCDIIDDSESRNSHLISCMLRSIEALVSSMVLYRDKIKIIRNEEFYSLVRNVSLEYSFMEAREHVYEMYINFYSDILTVNYTEDDFNILFLLLYFSVIIETFTEVEGQSEIEEKMPSYEDILQLFCTSIERLDQTHINNRDSQELTYLSYLSKRVSISTPSTIFSYLFKVNNLCTDIEDYLYKKELEKDRQRFIAGDFTKERNLEKEALLLANVSTGLEFEEYLVNLFGKLGYQVEGTKASGDQGADLIIIKDGIKTVVQAKFYSSKVGNKAVQEVVSAIAFYKADNGMVVTNNYYTPSAIELAEANNIKLVDGDKLNVLIRKVACNIELMHDKNNSISDFLLKDFNIGKCFYQNVLSEEIELVELILSGDEFITVKRSSGEEEVIGLMYPRECNVISQIAGQKDFSLVSIGQFYFGMHKEQITVVKEFIKVLNSIDSI